MEAAHSTTNSSKVIVQCHDPHNLFDSVASRLEPRLPLNKLHWKSPNRPLRSIDQLNVSFVRDDTKSEATINARRHQIPGLRQTPFVKVYLVRCDDRETYKESCRKDVKQWLKSQGFSQDGKSLLKGQERHDAYEYIILHVVFPGTAAAAQPRSSKHISIEASESTDSLNSKSKWGKSSSTLFDKLRADFSSSSKAPFERVAQIRLVDNDNKQSNALGPSEIEEQWQDLIEKLKTAILLSFDARVSQYEEDIRDRESQRQLPGWNFCTFFVLKEGLARGFANVGLIDDALTIYEELDAGLDTLVQDQASSEEPDPTSALLPFSSDLKPVIRKALDQTDETSEIDQSQIVSLNLQALIQLERQNFPFDVERRQYQQRILTNQVSALDFRVYIFTQQLQLRLRQAKVDGSVSKPTAAGVRAQYDLNAVATICEKAASFIALASRSLRGDLYTAWGGQEGLSDEELTTQKIVIGGIVASWKWSAIMQTLSDCRIPFLLVETLVDPTSSPGRQADDSGSNVTKLSGQARTLHENLASWAGELVDMARHVIQHDILSASQIGSWDEQITGIQSQTLRLLWTSHDTACDIYKLLSIHTYQCFESARRINASRSTLHALAKFEVDNNDIDQAIWWLEHVPNLINLQARTSTDRAVLKLYADCLRDQRRLDEYAGVLAVLLSNTVGNTFVRAMPRYDEQSQSALDELARVSDDLTGELSFEGFVTIQSVDKGISHPSEGGGFSLSVSLSLKFNASFTPSIMELVLLAREGQEPDRIVLRSATPIVLDGSVTYIALHTNIMTEGWYDVSQLIMKVGKLNFVHEFQSGNTTDEEHNKLRQSLVPSPIMIYPRNGAMMISVRSSPVADLTQAGRLWFEVLAGRHTIQDCLLRIRPATSGVRLDIRSAKVILPEGSTGLEVVQQDDSTGLLLPIIEASASSVFEISYTAETMPNMVSVRVEAQYKCDEYTAISYYHRTSSMTLPISVNVQDIFQVGRSFSRFTALPATYIPLRILSWNVEETDGFQVHQGTLRPDPVDVFQRLPTSWVVEATPQYEEQRKLPISVSYQTFDDIVLRSIESQFRKDVQDTTAEFAVELLVSYLLSRLRSMWNEQDIEEAVLLQELEMFSYESMDWQDTLRALNPPEKIQVGTWLKDWHTKQRFITLDASLAITRQLKLSVEMPRPLVVVSTSLHLSLHHQQPYLAVGQAVHAELQIECLCITDSEDIIHFEMNSPPETWLIGGKRKGSFEARTQNTKFNVILVAQRQGHLLLPSIDIRCRQYNDRGEPNNISIEVESKSQAKSVLVINNLEHTTVAMGADGTSGRHLYIDSRRRQDTD